MKDLIKQVALEVADKLNSAKQAGLSFTSRDEVIDEYAVKFATAFLAELSKRAEAVGYVECHEDGRQWIHRTRHGMDTIKNGDRVFNFPPIHDIEAIENQVAETFAEVCATRAMRHPYAHEVRRDEALACEAEISAGEWRKYK